VRAIDEEVKWAADDAGPRRHRLSNLRFAIVAPLVRMRLLLFSLPVFAIRALRHNTRLITLPASQYSGERGIWDRAAVRDILLSTHKLANGTPFSGVVDYAYDTPWLQDVIIVTLFAFVVYALVDVYTNLFWQSLGRAPRSWAPSRVVPGAGSTFR
jgi:hypothetical protein